jgi:hypothetical protein
MTAFLNGSFHDYTLIVRVVITAAWRQAAVKHSPAVLLTLANNWAFQ